MRHFGSIALLLFYIALLIFAFVQFFLDNCGIIALVICLVILVPLIVRQAFQLLREVIEQRNLDHYLAEQNKNDF